MVKIHIQCVTEWVKVYYNWNEKSLCLKNVTITDFRYYKKDHVRKTYNKRLKKLSKLNKIRNVQNIIWGKFLR